jgi:hypothetical protein
MMKLVLIALMFVGFSALADEFTDLQQDQRDPAAVSAISAAKRTYPGGADEEDLAVQARLPEAQLKTDMRTVQRGVYKTLYNQELKDERTEPVEE